ncbi:carbamoyltransferase [Robbsia andropogonis]|uniref:Carbamoyltransferase n=1 Tax=Robbsia andropogonis TaxID=28092 RepID=A0A0F5JTU1_9BURK|nr:carbamoyltransferase [Robbsia andropogonis]KKB61258.1 carbamoyltransferase [Robbsia andropogonis]MCP1120889.1 carbamoyltransferase [Robbsia andropogonis]MCP1130649.1 carbamoyltransferase [Robbsia andropogonis]
MNIVGISAHYHDAACCILVNGKLVAAAEEERFTRLKHDPSIPQHAFRYCLDAAGLDITDIDCVAYYEDPVKKLERQLWMTLPHLSVRPGLSFRKQADPANVTRDIRDVLGFEGRIEYFEHHRSHAASAYYYSGFDNAAVLTVDGVGEWNTMSFARGQGSDLNLLGTVDFPHSIGLLYSTITAYLGFEVNEGEYKVMGLAPYGKPTLVEPMSQLVRRSDGGHFELDLRYFSFVGEDVMFSGALVSLFGRPARQRGAALDPFHYDVARSLQHVLESLLLEKVRYLHALTPSDNLCLAGGVALNCVANGRIHREGPFKNVFVQPASNDSGCAFGAAALGHVLLTGEAPDLGKLNHVYLGSANSGSDVARLLENSPAHWQSFTGKENALLEAVASRLADGKVIGWVQGSMEFGPRALGARSILADPRVPDMRERINKAVKKREGFRPFAPSVLAAHASRHFDIDYPSPFMLETCQTRSELDLPSITHVDGSARVQTVDESISPRYARLIECFYRKTGCPLLLNTSFNLKDEPIVRTIEDALICFLRSAIDCLVIEDRLIDRDGVPETWLRRFDNTAPIVSSGIAHNVYSFI